MDKLYYLECLLWFFVISLTVFGMIIGRLDGAYLILSFISALRIAFVYDVYYDTSV